MPLDDLKDTIIKLSEDSRMKLKIEAEEREIDESLVFEEWIKENQDGFFVGEFGVEESVVTLKHIDPWTSSDITIKEGGSPEDRESNRKVYRRLRDSFPPVKAGIEYAKSFTSGGGFTVDIEDINDKIQIKNKKIINALNRNIFQDEIIRGLRTLLDIMIDDTFTVGASGAEIVYENEIDTEKLKEGEITSTEFPLDTPNIPEFETRDPNDKEWKKLGGVVQLKIIDDATERLIPYRNPTTYRIEYWTVDEVRTQKLNEVRAKEKLPPVQPRILYPWQVLWLPWSIRGTDIKGHSLIEGVAEIALLLENILNAVGISFTKWSDTKYFFILGTKDGRTWAPPKVRQFLKDVKKMTTTNGTGIAVPAGFDIKEIGGEVFEGGQIIDYLLTLITTGMTYPKTFLEQGSVNEGDQAWLAWIRTYSNYQNLLTTNIEHQLWARHLFCKVGTTQEVAKQGVSTTSRPKIPTYIPSMTWRSDGKWQTATKIEQLTKTLNVANPLSPELKMQVEKDIANTMGYSEMVWEVPEKYLEMQQKLLILDSEIEMLKAQMLVEALEQAKEDGIHLEMNPQLRGLSTPKPETEEIGAVMDTGQDQQKDMKDQEKQNGDDEDRSKQTNEKRPPPVPGKRLEGGVSRTSRDEDTEKGKSKPLGGSRQRKPRKVQETEQGIETFEDDIDETEYVEVPEIPQNQKVELEITVKQENTPQEIVVKSEPLQFKTEPIEVRSESKILFEKEKSNDDVQRDIARTNAIEIEGRVARIVEEKMKNIDSLVDRVAILEKEKEEFNRMKNNPSEKDLMVMKEKETRIKFMEQWMKENNEALPEPEKQQDEDDEQ